MISCSDLDELFEGHEIREQRAARAVAELGLQDGPHQIAADDRSVDLVTASSSFEHTVITDDEGEASSKNSLKHHPDN